MRATSNEKYLDLIKENYMVGVLASKTDYIPRGLGENEEPVSYSGKMNDIVFYIKPLSQEPIEISQIQEKVNMSNLYIGIGSRSISTLPSEYKQTYEIDKRIQIIRDKLEGKLLLFKPVLIYQEKLDRYHKNIEDIIVEEEYWKEGIEYHAVPRVNLEPIEFESKLLAEEPVDLEHYNHAMPAPSYILCGNYIYGNIKENQWRIDSSQNHHARVIIASSTVKKINVDLEEIQLNSGSERPNVVFLDEEYMFTTIADRLDTNGVFITEKEFVTVSEDKIDEKVDKDIFDIEDDKNIQQLDEKTFIRDLEQIAKVKGLVYSPEDLINFHTSMKSSALTILSGQSGIGKTKLATTYAEALGLSQNKKTMLIMPISPAYTEPGDILGYLNPSTGLYMAAETGLVDFLINAEANKNQIHMLIMDEMNLSQIEHYFSPFISLLELEERERYLHLYSKDSVCHNSHKYKHKIQLKDNLVIVGTMNTDETTKEISDRLLDRSNVVVLEKRSFKEIKNELEQFIVKSGKSSGLEDAYGELYTTWKSKSNYWEAFTDSELQFFDKLDGIISKVDPQKGFSIRNIIRMGDYLNNLPVNINGEHALNREKAIDLFIKQRVLTKIRGPIEIYEPLIGTLESSGEVSGELLTLFSGEEARTISDFEKTIKDLNRKARELSVNGYAT